MKGFLQLIAQFSSRLPYLQCAGLLNVLNEFALASQFERRARTVFQNQNELKLYLIKVKVRICSLK